MITVVAAVTDTPDDLRDMFQRAVHLELATLPPYLYALYSAGDANQPAIDRLTRIVHEEMIHMVLACNILNAIGGTPRITDPDLMPTYPGTLPGSIDDGLVVSLIPFSQDAMQQGMDIEEPLDPIVIGAGAGDGETQTIGQFYDSLKAPLTTLDLPWDEHPERQIGDATIFPGQVFPVHDAADAIAAIDRIVSEGEGSTLTPLDFQGELSHFYLFEEMHDDRLCQRAPDQPDGYEWGPSLGLDWSAAVPAICNPTTHDLTPYPEVQAAQEACDAAFTAMIDEIQLAVTGDVGRLGNAVAEMYALRRAADAAFAIPFGDPPLSAGPAFRYRPPPVG